MRPALGAWLPLAASCLLGCTAQPSPDRSGADLALAATRLEQGRVDQAYRMLGRLEDRTPGLAPVLNRAAVASLQAGATPAARRLLERSLRIQVDQGEAQKLLAAIYLSGGDEARAVALLQRAAVQDPSDFRPWYALGKVFHDQGRYEESAGAYEQALQRTPPSFEGRESQFGRARALLDANRGDEADPLIAELRRSASEDARAFSLAARRALDRGELPEALVLADRAVELGPTFDARFVRGRLRFLARRLEAAAEDLEVAASLKPNDVGALQLLAQVQEALGLKSKAAETLARSEQARRRRESIEAISRSVQERPDDPEARYRMGRAAEEAGMTTLAEQSYRAALDRNPSHRPAAEALAGLARPRPTSPSGAGGVTPPGPARPRP
ncbi:tetratricopeptide repeat protein [Paludisphaera mucosa]|uniref:Tetratricopeptide repeat protein n=1 Tax=Paludisphaera mucosa TaxID=3030827 RepID=A0ABT6FJC1_9BACT|nr:tetratricopeptide repeat protein [Paludisphaera mucosa]MDG3007671.1 tetratricopeptide repeat protein [Paludisphaera mucosa]